MATNTFWQLEKEFHILDHNHDLVLRVIEHKTITRTEGEGNTTQEVVENVANKVHEIKANRAVMSEYFPVLSASLPLQSEEMNKVLEWSAGASDKEQSAVSTDKHFAKLLSEMKIPSDKLKNVDINENSATALLVWLKIVHGAVDQSCYNLTIEQLWDMLAVAAKYGLKVKATNAKTWFEKWYGTNTANNRLFDYKEHSLLLLPTYAFSHAPGFQKATKYLVYRATGTIIDRCPKDFNRDNIKLDAGVVISMNAAKGRLKTVLHRDLYNPMDDLLKRARCRDKAEVLFAYEQLLIRSGAWPLEACFLQNSVEYTLRKLEQVAPSVWQPTDCGSKYCSFDFGYTIGKARMEVKALFDGLCLDCETASDPASGEKANGMYWSKTEKGINWDKGCRIRHGQPTWYFSFCGDRKKMTEWVEGKRAANNDNHEDRMRGRVNDGNGKKAGGRANGGARALGMANAVPAGERATDGVATTNDAAATDGGAATAATDGEEAAKAAAATE